MDRFHFMDSKRDDATGQTPSRPSAPAPARKIDPADVPPGSKPVAPADAPPSDDDSLPF
jgi:hypothetical protein